MTSASAMAFSWMDVSAIKSWAKLMMMSEAGAGRGPAGAGITSSRPGRVGVC